MSAHRSGSRCPTAASARCRPARRPAQVAEAIGPGLARAALAARVDGTVRDLDRPLEGDTTLAILTERDPDALERAAPLVGPHPGDRGARAVSRRRHRLRPADRGRLLLRLPGATVRSRPRTSAQIEAKMAEVAGARLPVRARGGGPGRGQPPVRRRSAQARAHPRAAATTRPSRSTPTARFRTSAAGPHIPAHRPAQALQAAARRRRLLAGRRAAGRCCSGSTAPPGSRRRTSTPTSTGWRRRGSATTGGWARSSTCSCSIPSRPGAPFWTERGTTLYDVINEYMREREPAGRLPGDQDARCCTTRGCGRSSGHWGKYRENMFLVLDKRDRRARLLAQADELPVALICYFGTRKH